MNALVVLRDMKGNLRSRQEWVALQVAPGHHHMIDVSSCLRKEAVTPDVEGLAEAGGAGGGLEEIPIQAKRKSAPKTETGTSSGFRENLISPAWLSFET